MKILLTGAAGFIGFHVCRELTALGLEVVGIDNINDYYDIGLKNARLAELGDSIHFEKMDIANQQAIFALFEQHKFDRVVHLAAQAGVRYSIENPQAYIDSNLVGFGNILEASRRFEVEHLVFASSSSVYGANKTMPFKVTDNVDHPVSLYAATKKSNELMAHSYSHLYQLPCTGLRFFTVYGEWGRPDMSPFLFANAILEGKPIKVFNYGKHRRDFTYIDDIVSGVIATLKLPAASNAEWDGLKPDPSSSSAPYKIYNIGNGKPVELLHFIELLEQNLGKETSKEMLPMQPGDVEDTYADISAMERDFGYHPNTNIETGLKKFVEWYRGYYQ